MFRIPQVPLKRGNSRTYPLKERLAVQPRPTSNTVWSTALGLHLDSINEEEEQER